MCARVEGPGQVESGKNALMGEEDWYLVLLELRNIVKLLSHQITNMQSQLTKTTYPPFIRGNTTNYPGQYINTGGMVN